MLERSAAFSGFTVDDIPAARHFYGELLGLTVAETNGMLRLTTSGGRETLIYPNSNHQPAQFTILNFPVDDIDEAVDALVSAGVAIIRYDGMPQDEKGVMRGRAVGRGPDIAWFHDPAGNVLSVLRNP
ncbi:putative enzyme related to lactoylglutathione lyase [Nakamurella sp. UYEF19]|uniref:VOC family protein n=1 Tax=Nakamurella sp. UYEF19 TaxID=1756392 RepID=UPI00339ADD1D